MKVSRKLLENRLKEVKEFGDIRKLGFTGEFQILQDYTNDDSYFERLWVTVNDDGLGVVILDEGNQWCSVIAFLDEFLVDKMTFNEGDGLYDQYIKMTSDEIKENVEMKMKAMEKWIEENK